jgi:thiamine biosynthesis protein ThiI
MHYDAIVVHFGEIWLKGKNRNDFVNTLLSNISASLKGIRYKKLENERDHFMVYLNKAGNPNQVIERLEHIPGISWVAPVLITEPTIEHIIKAAEKLNPNPKMAIRIEVNRSYKQHTFNSNDVIGAFLKLNRSGKLKILLDKEAKDKLHINILKESALLYSEKTKGIGGLPVGSSGKTIVLLSGGIDSPVAAFYAMKRGLEPIYVHFHTFPSSGKAVHSKIPKLISILMRYSNKSKVYYVPSHPFQAASIKVQTKYELVLFKRFIYKFADKIAKIEDARSIVTGESIGQVASQTIENMKASQSGISSIILRPLSGFDKEEITAKAKDIGTYSLSIQKYRDVCSIKIKNPSTKAHPEKIDRLYEQCGLDEVLEKTYALSCLKTID